MLNLYTRALLLSGLLLLTGTLPEAPAQAEPVTVSIPLLVVFDGPKIGTVVPCILSWHSDPMAQTVTMTKAGFGLTFIADGQTAFQEAYQQALRLTGLSPAGLLSVSSGTPVHMQTHGRSVGAALTIGFVAAFLQHTITPGIAITGTIEPSGAIGPVGQLPAKVAAAAKAGYRTVLVPAGQLRTSEWNLTHLAADLQIDVIEVKTIGEAYSYFTGYSL